MWPHREMTRGRCCYNTASRVVTERALTLRVFSRLISDRVFCAVKASQSLRNLETAAGLQHSARCRKAAYSLPSAPGLLRGPACPDLKALGTLRWRSRLAVCHHRPQSSGTSVLGHKANASSTLRFLARLLVLVSAIRHAKQLSEVARLHIRVQHCLGVRISGPRLLRRQPITCSVISSSQLHLKQVATHYKWQQTLDMRECYNAFYPCLQP